MPDRMDRHLITLANFYQLRGQRQIAEDVYRQVLDKLDKDQSTNSVNFNLVMALNLYGRSLLADPVSREEANEYLKQSEALSRQMPFWYDSIDCIYLSEFNMD